MLLQARLEGKHLGEEGACVKQAELQSVFPRLRQQPQVTEGALVRNWIQVRTEKRHLQGLWRRALLIHCCLKLRAQAKSQGEG